MTYTIAIDSFKGSLTSAEAAEAAELGIKQADSEARIHILPLADGGEGTVRAIAGCADGELRYAEVTGPLGERVRAEYAVLGGNKAVIEMAAAAGLPLVPPDLRDPMHTTTFGVGELIRTAIAEGCRDFIIGIGGSATNDGGAGCLQALGFGLLDENGEQIPFGAAGLSRLKSIKADSALPQLKRCRFFIACDVDNPLCGEHGASRIFAPQKGARPEDILLMDRWLGSFAELTKALTPEADPSFPGAGAAGGLGFALKYFLGGAMRSGAELILEMTGAERCIADSDCVITGEGRIDGQTAMGKAPIAVAALAKRLGKPCLGFAGSIGEGAELCLEKGMTSYYCINDGKLTLEEAMDKANAAKALANAVRQAVMFR
ncbi:MAG: glycerate kinase [Ruminococcus sp.]|nr:glycerate kinase [Ruminococcus sp.]